MIKHDLSVHDSQVVSDKYKLDKIRRPACQTGI